MVNDKVRWDVTMSYLFPLWYASILVEVIMRDMVSCAQRFSEGDELKDAKDI